MSACRVCGQLLDDLDAAICEACRANGNGARRCYQLGCQHPACKAANTAYSASYRRAYHAGHPPLGAHVAGSDAALVIAELVTEGFRKADIARALGYTWPRLQVNGTSTLRTLLRLRRLQRTWTT